MCLFNIGLFINKKILIKNLPEEERPREKLLKKGADSLSNEELLAIVLGSGTRDTSAKGLAERIICQSSMGLRFLTECVPEELTEIKGIGIAKACNLIAAAELGRRISSFKNIKDEPVKSPLQAAGFVMEEMRYMRHEEFWVMLLGTDGKILSIEKITVGTLNEAPVHPREIFNPAIRKRASSIILIHNHPSGNPEPSIADINVTRRMVEAGRILGMEVKDHIIIGDGEFISLKERHVF